MYRYTRLWTTFLLVATVPVFAQGGGEEVLYFADAHQTGVDTQLFRVHLAAQTLEAELTPLPGVGFGPGVIPLDQVTAIAVTPDGELLYALDSNEYGSVDNGELGVYDLVAGSWQIIGQINYGRTPIRLLDSAAFSPEGLLYAASSQTKMLYVIDTETAAATPVGYVVNQDTNVTVNLKGADLAFTPEGVFYLWTNGGWNGAPSGLYALTLPESPRGRVMAAYLGSGSVAHNVRGLALHDNGTGDLLASVDGGNLVVLDRSTVETLETYALVLDGLSYVSGSGDMSIGPMFTAPTTLNLRLDIKPGDCPNPMNRRGRGVVSMALLGSESFDIADIDVDSLFLTRADGVGGAAIPLTGPPGPGTRIQDVATPFDGEPCDCIALDGDGWEDLVLKFSRPEMVEALQLEGLLSGTSIELVIEGALYDGTPFVASDCVALVGPPHAQN